MQRSIRRLLSPALALLAVAAVMALAGALSSGTGVRIVAPNSVWGGQPITGYVTGGKEPMMARATDGTGSNMPNSPTVGMGDPLYFSFPTTESMAGTVVMIHASSPDGSSATASVAIK